MYKFIVSCASDRWAVHATMDLTSCNALVDFNVRGKPNPPPVKLIAIVWTLSHKVPSGTQKKYVIEFYDPSSTLASALVPLNTWVQVEDVVFDKVMSRKTSPAGAVLIHFYV